MVVAAYPVNDVVSRPSIEGVVAGCPDQYRKLVGHKVSDMQIGRGRRAGQLDDKIAAGEFAIVIRIDDQDSLEYPAAGIESRPPYLGKAGTEVRVAGESKSVGEVGRGEPARRIL